MGMIILLILVVAIVVAVLQTQKKSSKTGALASRSSVDYKARPLFHNKGAHAMFNRLSEALPEHCVHAEVGLMAFIQPTGKASLRGRGLIGQSRVDYLITNSSGQTVCGIELDGSSHDNEKAAARDQIKDEAFRLAGIRLIRLRAESAMKGAELRALVLSTP